MHNPFTALVHFFKRLGPKLGTAIHVISHLITEEQFAHALEYVAEAAANATFANANRQTQVVSRLMKLGMPEHLARLATEMAVTQLKHAEDAGVAKLEELYRMEAEWVPPAAESVVLPLLPMPTMAIEDSGPGETTGQAIAPVVDPDPGDAQPPSDQPPV